MSLHYIVREPKQATENPPLLILLHGYGSNEQDLFSFAEELPDNLLIVSAQAPHSMEFGAYAWYAINFDNIKNIFGEAPQTPPLPNTPMPKVKNVAQNIVPTTGLTQAESALLSPSEQLIRQRSRRV